MRKASLIVFSPCVLLLSLAVLWAKEKPQKKGPSDETYLGPISCTVTTFKVVVPVPAGEVGQESLPNQAPPQKAGNNDAVQNPRASATPQAPGGDGTTPTPALNVLPLKPVLTLKDCLGHGGQVVITPDGARNRIIIENPEAIKGYEWHRLSISGYLRGAAFHIVSVRII